MFEKYATTLDARFEANETFWFEMLWHSDSTCYDIMIRHVMTFWFEMLWHSDSKSYDILKRNVMTFWFELLWHSDSKCYDILICHVMTLMVTSPWVLHYFFVFAPRVLHVLYVYVYALHDPPRFFFHDPLIFSTTLHGFCIIFYICPMVFAWVMVTPSTIPCGPRIPNIESIQGPFFNMCN